MDSRRVRILSVSVISALAVLILFFLPRIPQPLTYHSFADQRTFLHLHNTLNVLSNVPFLVVGVFGLRSLLRAPARQSTIRFSIPDERWSYILFFLGALLTGFGSGYYHFAPSNNTLVWDRLPMTMAFLSFLAASISERIRLAAGFRLLPALA